MNKGKKIFLTGIVTVLCGKLFGMENFSISMQHETGVLNGHIYEYVFDEECLNTDNMLSKLDWELVNIPYFELNLNFDFSDSLNLFLMCKTIVPKNSGYMQDYDWMNSIIYLWKDENPTELTNYSKHTNYLSEFYSFRAGINCFNFFLTPNIKVMPFLAWDYDYIQFDANDGYCTYKSYNWEKQAVEGKVISYRQEITSLMFGQKISVAPTNRLDFSVLFMQNLNLGFNTALDYHYLKNYLYRDDLKFAFILKAKATISYKINYGISIGASLSGQYSPITKGDDSATSITSDGTVTGKQWIPQDAQGGSSSYMWSGSLFFKMTL